MNDLEQHVLAGGWRKYYLNWRKQLNFVSKLRLSQKRVYAVVAQYIVFFEPSLL